jgi:hypothetical protein
MVQSSRDRQAENAAKSLNTTRNRHSDKPRNEPAAGNGAYSHAPVTSHGKPRQAHCPGLPWQNGFAGREAHLRLTLQAYARYYNEIRTHQSPDKDHRPGPGRPRRALEIGCDVRFGSKTPRLFRVSRPGFAGCRHGSERAVRWSSCPILLSIARLSATEVRSVSDRVGGTNG